MNMYAPKWIVVLLSISLGANLWFIWRWFDVNTPTTPNTVQTRQNIETSDKSDISHAWQPHPLRENIDKSSNSALNPSVDDSISQKEHFDYLKALAKARDFDALEFEVSNYLRKYPQDVDAMMLEAEAYYHTKPLNVALVHYHELLSKPLSNAQIEDVQKIIAVNTTRVIQQFSGDGAWNLLAAFLEPLVQVDPLNRQYLLALARAYGMQEQFTLMEDVLANFIADDPRATRLRKAVMARLGSQELIETEEERLVNLDTIDETEQRRADMTLRQQNGQFVATVFIPNARVNLLLDTGASTTAISDTKFASIPKNQTHFLGKFNINTAGGTIQAPFYKVSVLQIGSKELKDVSMLVLPSENLQKFDGLLGMNVLSQFDLDYNAQNKTMRLFKK